MNNPNDPNAQNNPEIHMDGNSLFQEEVFTDNAVGTLRRLTPVNADGSVDSSRAVQFVGSTQVMTTAGPLPLNFEIEAENLAQAAEGFGDGAKQAFERTMEELKEMQRQQASQIVVPKGGMDPMGGGMGGGGGIQMP